MYAVFGGYGNIMYLVQVGIQTGAEHNMFLRYLSAQLSYYSVCFFLPPIALADRSSINQNTAFPLRIVKYGVNDL